MESFATIVPLVVFLPLAGMILNMIFGQRLGERAIGAIASIAVGSAFIVSVTLLIALHRFGFEAAVITPPILTHWITIPAANLEIPWQFRVDSLSVTMMLVVTGVGTLIHIYAIGYMHGDSRFVRFFMYLNLFVAFMLILVTGNNYLVTFVGWEGVGLCSFMLIGFWFDKKHGEGWKNSNAARKAFIVNRVGDFGFLMAIFLTFWTFGTLDYYRPGEPIVAAAHGGAPVAGDHGGKPADDGHGGVATPPATKPATDTHGGVATPPATKSASDGHSRVDDLMVFAKPINAETPPPKAAAPFTGQKGIFGQAKDMVEKKATVQLGSTTLPIDVVINLIVLFILIGVTGKSAQIPLFVWLPDAMAGPTPVSALIHAATMVTSGLFLMTRSADFLAVASFATFVITVVGALTAVFAGFVALGQWDIKKVLAYSTVSQLGFMVAAVGLGAYTAAFFHLITHAFFKALLFLGSGSVIHGMEHGHHHVEHSHGHGDHGHDEHHDHAHDAHADHGDHDHGHAHVATNTPIPQDPPPEVIFDPQDMRNMGGLRHKMPITFWTYLIGTLALAGIFPLSGFWSKDEILGAAFRSGFNNGELKGYLALGLLMVAAFFTAFYMWRQIRYVFLGNARTEAAEHVPESVNAMTIPLIVLAGLSVVGGLLNIPIGLNTLTVLATAVVTGAIFVLALRSQATSSSRFMLAVQMGVGIIAVAVCAAAVGSEDALALWLEHTITAPINLGPLNPLLALAATGVGVGAIFLADQVYGRNNPLTKKGRDPLEARADTRPIFALANAKGYTDAIYNALLEQPFNRASKWLADRLDWEFWHNTFHEKIIWKGFDGFAGLLSKPVDRSGIDQAFLVPGRIIQWVAGRLKGLQTGYVRTYAFTMLIGVLLIVFLMLFPLLRQLIGG
jgi:NADH-quinone oxidoreductase subunit L